MSFGESDRYETWRELPTADFIYKALQHRAVLQAKVRALALEIQIEEAHITQKKPRDKAVRFVGIEDAEHNHPPYILDLRRELIKTQADLDMLEAEVKMFEFRKDVFKSLSFKERL